MYFSEDTILASHGINFNYSVDDYEYERSQRLPPNLKKLYGNLQVDKEYKVKYLVKNPQRAILILDNEWTLSAVVGVPANDPSAEF